MKTMIHKKYSAFQWVLGAIVLFVSLAVWTSVRSAKFDDMTVYALFPLLGLVAFGLMWTHYIHGALRRAFDAPDYGKDTYWYVSSGLVLACLLLHPMLLSFGLWRDGLGLPPFSYMSAYDSMKLAVLLGSLSLTVFLVFELYRWFNDRSWWRYIEAMQVVAMLAVFIHALLLGGELNENWFRVIWWGYGITLVIAQVYTYRYDKKRGA